MGRAYLPESWVRNPKASTNAKALASVLSSFAASDGGDQDVWPAPQTVADCLGVSQRTVRDASTEGETLGWWTRIHERTRTGGIALTWRLHFPVFSTNGSPTEAQRQPVAAGVPLVEMIAESPTEAQRKPNGSPTEAERQPAATGRYEGKKVGMEEGESAASPPAPKGERRPFKPPTTAEVAEVMVSKNVPPSTAKTEAAKFVSFYESKGWKVGKTTMVNWKSAVAGWVLRGNLAAASERLTWQTKPSGRTTDEGLLY